MIQNFRIKLKNSCTKQKCLCASLQHCRKDKNLLEVQEQNKVDETMISKNTGDVTGASKITYVLLWQFPNTEK